MIWRIGASAGVGNVMDDDDATEANYVYPFLDAR